MSFRSAALTGLLVLLSAVHAAPTLTDRRRASLEATLRHARWHPEVRSRCGPFNGDVKTDVIAFPGGRADRLYLQDGFQGRAYQIKSGTARLVWCGAHPPPGQQASNLRGNAARALGIPFRTASGVFPVERGGMDVFTGFAGSVTTTRMNAAGEIVCSQRRFEESHFRSAFQFGARDTCP